MKSYHPLLMDYQDQSLKFENYPIQQPIYYSRQSYKQAQRVIEIEHIAKKIMDLRFHQYQFYNYL